MPNHRGFEIQMSQIHLQSNLPILAKGQTGMQRAPRHLAGQCEGLKVHFFDKMCVLPFPILL